MIEKKNKQLEDDAMVCRIAAENCCFKCLPRDYTATDQRLKYLQKYLEIFVFGNINTTYSILTHILPSASPLRGV